MKRLISVILAAVLVTTGLTACQGGTTVTDTTTTAATAVATTVATTESATSNLINLTIEYRYEKYEKTVLEIERGTDLEKSLKRAWDDVSKVPYGFDFTGWFNDEACTQATDLAAVPAEDVTVYAGWQAWSAEKTDLMDQFYAELDLSKTLILCPTMYEQTSFMDYYNYTNEKCVIGVIRLADTNKVTPDMVATMKAKREALVQVKEKDEVWYDIWLDEIPAAADAAEYDYFNMIDTKGFRPLLAAYLVPDQSTVKGNIIVIAGGGYFNRANQGEGLPVCEYFNSIGYNAFLLQRRVSPSQPVDAGLDIQRSIRYLRYFADEKGIGAIDHLGAIGFSGGGMTIMQGIMTFYGDVLPSTVYSDYKPDEVDAVNSDLDTAMIIYGGMPPFETANPNLPAAFIAAGAKDSLTDGSLELYKFLNNLTTTELHIYPSMPHGFGLGKSYEGGDEMRSQINEFLEVEFGYTPRIKK